MKKIALFVAIVIVFGGLYTYLHLINSKSIKAVNNSTSISKTCDCIDPKLCKEQGNCNEAINCGEQTCQAVKAKVTTPEPSLLPPCCRDKGNK
jgi:hypothetical protein